MDLRWSTHGPRLASRKARMPSRLFHAGCGTLLPLAHDGWIPARARLSMRSTPHLHVHAHRSTVPSLLPTCTTSSDAFVDRFVPAWTAVFTVFLGRVVGIVRLDSTCDITSHRRTRWKLRWRHARTKSQDTASKVRTEGTVATSKRRRRRKRSPRATVRRRVDSSDRVHVADGKVGSLVDALGHFYKPMQVSDRHS